MKKALVMVVCLSMVGSSASASMCDTFFLNLFCKKTWTVIGKDLNKGNKNLNEGTDKFLDDINY